MAEPDSGTEASSSPKERVMHLEPIIGSDRVVPVRHVRVLYEPRRAGAIGGGVPPKHRRFRGRKTLTPAVWLVGLVALLIASAVGLWAAFVFVTTLGIVTVYAWRTK